MSTAKKVNANEVPEGFQDLSGFSGKKVIFDKPGMEIRGIIKEIKEIPNNGDPFTLMTIEELSTGDVLAVSKSAGLSNLFDNAKVGQEVFIHYKGENPDIKKLNNCMKEFSAGVR